MPISPADDLSELRALQADADAVYQKLQKEGRVPGPQQDTTRWIAARERGYVNCLLTLLAEGTEDSITVVRGQELPHLGSLTQGPESLKTWATRLAFPYSQLSTDGVLSILSDSFSMRNAPRGRLKTVLVRQDGSPLAVLFYADQSPEGRGLRISVVRSK